MAMNLLHQRRCSSVGWADMVRDELLPWALADIELGDQTLEMGPGYGATLRALIERAGAVTRSKSISRWPSGWTGCTATGRG